MADRVESVSIPSLPNFPVRWLRVKTLATSSPRAVATPRRLRVVRLLAAHSSFVFTVICQLCCSAGGTRKHDRTVSARSLGDHSCRLMSCVFRSELAAKIEYVASAMRKQFQMKRGGRAWLFDLASSRRVFCANHGRITPSPLPFVKRLEIALQTCRDNHTNRHLLLVDVPYMQTQPVGGQVLSNGCFWLMRTRSTELLTPWHVNICHLPLSIPFGRLEVSSCRP